MNLADSETRFEELCAGRALGDLSHEEERDLALLSAELGRDPDLAYELLATCIELDFLKEEPLPAALAQKLKEQFKAPSNIVHPQVSTWGKVLRSPLTGWAAAAAIALFALISAPKQQEISPVSLREEARDLVERKFTGIGNFAQAGGSVIWSDERQHGYMTLSGIPANDPQRAQYQLWIVDPKRDEAPVDGGVFDIPAGGGPVVVPISAKLALTDPQAFVITLEQPGGVVKSKQEQVVALAKL